MRKQTGAERYFADRKASSTYKDAYERARVRGAFVDDLMRSLDDERRAQNLSKAELARRAGLKPEAVRRLFSHTPVNPTISTLCALANALDVEMKVVRPSGRSRRAAPTKVRSDAA